MARDREKPKCRPCVAALAESGHVYVRRELKLPVFGCVRYFGDTACLGQADKASGESTDFATRTTCRSAFPRQPLRRTLQLQGGVWAKQTEPHCRDANVIFADKRKHILKLEV